MTSSRPAICTKHVVLRHLVDELRSELQAALSAAAVARDEATGEESKAENQYDTRAIEAGYLAGAQSRRVDAMRQAVALYESVLANPSGHVRARLVHAVAADGLHTAFLLGPAAAGHALVVEGVPVRVVTPASPVGARLATIEVGDELALAADRGRPSIELEVVSVE